MGNSTVDQYLNEIGRYRLLTPEEEIQLGRRVQRMIELKEQDRELSPEEKREVRLGEQASERFLRSNLRLVVMAAKKYAKGVRTMDIMDLIQEGNIGLLRGIEKYDPSRGYKFSTYAYWWIRQAMTRAIANKERTIRLPGKVVDIATNWNKVVVALSQELGRTPTYKEIASRFDCAVQEIETFMARGHSTMLSLDVMVAGDTKTALIDFVADPDDMDNTTAMEKALFDEYYSMLDTAMRVLDEREQDMMRRKWGLNGVEKQNLTEIAKVYGVSRERVRQVTELAQRKIRASLANSPKFSGDVLRQSFPRIGRALAAA
jgi:RNA polymerase primary sigma factor